MILQLAQSLLPKVTVIATASDAERERWAADLGAEHTVNHHGDLAAQVRDIAPGGVDWVFTAHSAGQIELYAQLVRPFGHIVAIDDGPRDVEPLKQRSIAWHWELMFTRPLFTTPDITGQHDLLTRVSELVDAHRIRPTTTEVLQPITAATLERAHAMVRDGHMVGKVVVEGWD
ncbi:zinc-binding dehydrogenase [Corynebacterium pacaense]|uniref:zinc-binding dehydrogenase n=1 Tax=Corynebacterium pacaense TaxID=1816684 RepID=UPI001FEAF7DD|nr:zinc-binding dehydrogenase [Corynebacterium pacaense]